MALSRALLISGTRLNFAYDVDYDTAKRNFVPLTPAFNYTSANDALEIFSAVTCALSIIGSLVIILSYIFIREIRSKARELLVHISIMNLIYTTANFVGLIVPYDKCLFHRKGREHCNFKWLCEAQAFLGAYGTAGSILWTLGLSLYSYFGLARLDIDDHCLIKGIVIVLYVVCYLLPLYPSLWLLLGGHLGFPQSAHEGGGWCTVFIENDNKNASNYDQDMPLIMADGHGLWTWVAFMMMLHICLVHKLVDHCPMRIAKVRDSIVSNNVHCVLGAAPALHF